MSLFLEKNNAALPKDLIKNECLLKKPDEKGKFLIPDVITHSPPGRLEFYELKPNSTKGVKDGRDKVLFFEALSGVHSLPYLAGTLYDPDFRKLIWDGTWRGMPFKAFLHIFRREKGLLVYEICVESKPEFLTEAVVKALVQFLVAALIVLLITGGAAIVIAAPILALGGSVGDGGDNDPQDIRFVQELLNDWRGRNSRTLLAVDGLVGPNTRAAIGDFQTVVTGVVDWRVDKDGAAIRKLEALHLAALPDQAGADWTAIVPDLTDIVDSISKDPDVTSLQEDELRLAAIDYLTELYNA